MSDTPHRATPKQWALIEQFAAECGYDSCLLDLRDRLAALEAKDLAYDEAWASVRRANSELCDRLAAAEQRISKLEGSTSRQEIHEAEAFGLVPAVEPPELDKDLANELCYDGPFWKINLDIADRIYRAGWDAAMAASTCPHIRSSDEGTSFCILAEQVANSQPTPNDRQIRRSLVEVVAAAIHPSICADRNLYLHEARAAILAVAGWMLSELVSHSMAERLEQEASQ